jgi:hypothetical protein
LNCVCDGMSKDEVWRLAGVFPLEPLAIYIGKDKLTTDMAGELRFWVHKQLKKVFYQLGLISPRQFHQVAWRQVHDIVQETPRMFQICASKQVTNSAGVNRNLAKYTKKQCSRCPSCDAKKETCNHVLHCNSD